MERKNKLLLVAIIIPILMLLSLNLYKYFKLTTGVKIIIPIEGYDPRDLLSGHYLIYRLSLDIENAAEYHNAKDVYLCINQVDDDKIESVVRTYISDDLLNDYDAVIRGRFVNGRFLAGIERFYIPEQHAQLLDKVVRKGKGKIIVSVDRNGKALVKDLLINDKSWLEYVEENK